MTALFLKEPFAAAFGKKPKGIAARMPPCLCMIGSKKHASGPTSLTNSVAGVHTIKDDSPPDTANFILVFLLAIVAGREALLLHKRSRPHRLFGKSGRQSLNWVQERSAWSLESCPDEREPCRQTSRPPNARSRTLRQLCRTQKARWCPEQTWPKIQDEKPKELGKKDHQKCRRASPQPSLSSNQEVQEDPLRQYERPKVQKPPPAQGSCRSQRWWGSRTQNRRSPVCQRIAEQRSRIEWQQWVAELQRSNPVLQNEGQCSWR